MTTEIKVEKPTKDELDALGVQSRSTWSCEPSTFDWEYDANETCYILEGQVNVSTDKGAVEFGKGDLVVFPKGLKCKWNVIKRVNKVYKFD